MLTCPAPLTTDDSRVWWRVSDTGDVYDASFGSGLDTLRSHSHFAYMPLSCISFNFQEDVAAGRCLVGLSDGL